MNVYNGFDNHGGYDLADDNPTFYSLDITYNNFTKN